MRTCLTLVLLECLVHPKSLWSVPGSGESIKAIMSYVWITKMVQLHGDNPCMRLPWANLVVRSWLDEFGVQEVANVRAGANGLAAARDFQTPVARFEERECDYVVLHKFNGQLFQAQQARARLHWPIGVRSSSARSQRPHQCVWSMCSAAGAAAVLPAYHQSCGLDPGRVAALPFVANVLVAFRSTCACCVPTFSFKHAGRRQAVERLASPGAS